MSPDLDQDGAFFGGSHVVFAVSDWSHSCAPVSVSSKEADPDPWRAVKTL